MLLEPPICVTRQRDVVSGMGNKQIGGKPSYIRDSAHFVEKLRKIQFNPDDILVSFDVVSLFTKVPLIDTLRCIFDLFRSDITQPFKYCLRTSYFVWDGSFYEQTDGVAMGSLLSPLVANLFMEQFESLSKQRRTNLWFGGGTWMIRFSFGHTEEIN
ncbi:hypothetical protein Trydic_g6111 [Trypoxylus dichotomus]